MTEVQKITMGRRLARFGVRLTAFALTAFVLLVIAVQGFVIWLNTTSGSHWIEARANAAIAPMGYSLVLKDFALTKFIGIKVKQFELSQRDRRILSARNVGVLINPLPLAAKKLNIGFDAGELTVLAMPSPTDKGQEPAPKDPFQPIAKPDIFFTTVKLSVNMAQLNIAESVSGKPLSTNLSIEHSIDFSSADISMQGAIKTARTNQEFAAVLPKQADYQARFDVGSQSIVIDDLNIIHDVYSVAFGGSYGLEERAISARIKSLYTLANAQSVSLTSEFSGTTEALNGGVKIESAYQDYALDLSAGVTLMDKTLVLSNVQSASPDITLKGEVAYSLETALAEGFVTMDIAQLSRFAPLIGREDLRGGLYLTADILNKDGVQGIEGNADIANLYIQGASLEKGKVSAAIDNLAMLDTLTINGALRNINAHGILISDLDIAVAPVKDKAHIRLNGKGFRYQPFTFSADADFTPGEAFVVDVKNLRFAPKDGTIEAVGKITSQDIDLKVTGQGLTAKTMPFVELGNIPAKISSLSVTLDGAMAAPRLKAAAKVTASASADQYATIDLNAAYEGGLLSAGLDGSGTGVDQLEARGQIPLMLSLNPFIVSVPDAGMLDARFAANTRLAAIAPYVLDENMTLKGALSSNGTVQGALSDINVNGDIRLQDGAFTDRVNGLAFKNIVADVRLENRAIRKVSLSAENADGAGRISLEGSGNLNNMKRPDITAEMVVDNLTVVDNRQYDARINANVNLEIKGEGYVISGKVEPLEVNIQIPNEIDPAVPQLNIIAAEDAAKDDNILKKFALDVTLNAKDQVFVSGRGLTSELSGDLEITGNLAVPLVNGNMKTVRGRYEEFGRRFDLKRTVLRFQGEVPPSPYLDVEAVTDIDGVTAKILISNSVENPKIKLASTPSLPDDEVLSLILFGKNIQQISPFQAIQLANTLRKFSGVGGGDPDVFQQLRNTTGLDDIRIGADAEGGATVGAGKYISEKVYLQVEKGAGETSGAASLEVELTPRITLESEAKQNGDTGAGIFWEWDY